MTIGRHIKKTNPKSDQRRRQTSRKLRRSSSGTRASGVKLQQAKERSKTGIFAISGSNLPPNQENQFVWGVTKRGQILLYIKYEPRYVLRGIRVESLF